MKIYVGTSGWLYSWNEGRSFEWYVENSKLNSVELNSSFYRFPYPNQIKGWANKSENICFSIKVHRKITHLFKLSGESKDVWKDFENLFSPLKEKIVFYLFQMPPSFSTEFFDRVGDFFSDLKDKERFAIEFRHKSWFSEEWVKKIEKIGLVFVSVDSPEIRSFIVKTNETIYLRFHGRTGWYSHNYTKEEFEEIVAKIKLLKPERIFVYFNNNHNMLSNAQEFYKILKKLK
ncbi:MAG: DUF72 domain-containing protein [Candidatus Omnitrophica bacterium]|nr:DUF72 domain-containing protein [Candidatus Omnitrophota bacterium]MCM8806767.1 DUF72 domain-containing protein [Candidatus Omnitrophota bacterium]